MPSLPGDALKRLSVPYRPIRRLISEWRRPSVQTCELLLPPEIMNTMVEFLPKHAVIAFSLTCRAFYQTYFPKTAELDEVEKRALLTILERDIGHLYFCHYCTMLHTWSSKWGVRSLPKQSYRPCSYKFSFTPGPQYTMLYCHAHLVMNRHTFGPSYGLSPASLEQQETRFSFGAQFKQSWQARIIGDELFLSAICTISYPWGDGDNLRAAIDQHTLFLCRHLHTHGRTVTTERYYRLPELDRDIFSLEKSPKPPGIVRSCALCLTDYQVNVSWQGSRAGWVIEIVSWHQFGTCSSPMDWKWHAMTYSGMIGDPRHKHCLPGQVRKKWFEESSTKPEGQFVVPSGGDRFDEFEGMNLVSVLPDFRLNMNGRRARSRGAAVALSEQGDAT